MSGAFELRSAQVSRERHNGRVDAGSRSIRIVDICNLSSSANALLKNRVLAMREQGLDNRIICSEGSYVRVLEEAGIPVHTVPIARGFDPVQVIQTFVGIFLYLKREKIDLIHTHFSVPGFLGRVAARLAGVPVIVHTIHGFPFHDQSSRIQRKLYILLERCVGRIADMVLSQNRANLDEALRHAIVPREHIRFIGNGISLERFRPVRHSRPVDGTATISCVARMEKVKNHPMLFEAVRILKQRGERFRVWLVGQGVLRAQHEKLCERMGIADVVQFLGYRDDVPEILAQSDIAVLTSFKEGVPRAVLEAMASGIPVVATRIPGSIDAIQEGTTGFTVSPGDSAALADRLSQLIRDERLRYQMGIRAREIVEEQFDEQVIIESLGHVYRDLLSRKGVVGSATNPQAVTS